MVVAVVPAVIRVATMVAPEGIGAETLVEVVMVVATLVAARVVAAKVVALGAGLVEVEMVVALEVLVGEAGIAASLQQKASPGQLHRCLAQTCPHCSSCAPQRAYRHCT